MKIDYTKTTLAQTLEWVKARLEGFDAEHQTLAVLQYELNLCNPIEDPASYFDELKGSKWLKVAVEDFMDTKLNPK